MAEWTKIDKLEKIDPAFSAIKSQLLDGTIDTMYKLIDYNPTKIGRLLSMSYKTLITKLQEPWKFSTLNILVLAYALRVDPDIIYNIIQKESENVVCAKIEAFKIREQKLKENATSKKPNLKESSELSEIEFIKALDAVKTQLLIYDQNMVVSFSVLDYDRMIIILEKSFSEKTEQT